MGRAPHFVLVLLNLREVDTNFEKNPFNLGHFDMSSCRRARDFPLTRARTILMVYLISESSTKVSGFLRRMRPPTLTWILEDPNNP